MFSKILLMGLKVRNCYLSEIVDDHVTERGEDLALVCCGQADDLGSSCASGSYSM